MSDASPLIPSAGQLAWQREHQLALFCHFGINTFHGREWSDGSLPVDSFDPTDLDAHDWAEAAREAGAAHLILTAKHHDGFCLWPTETTAYSVRSSPWKDGHGDVVAEAAGACRDAGIGFGVYLSPWDRHEPTWTTNHAAYDALYIRQLTELCTRYGELFEIWFDGAGSERHPYNWDTIMETVARHQPRAMIFNMGRPTIRWVGNEDGLAADPCWYTVDATHRSIHDTGVDALPAGTAYLPPECDVAIRRHWFWHEDDLASLKSRHHLEAIWYRSVGLGANLLLNVPPGRRGRLDPDDRARLVEFGKGIAERFATPIPGEIVQKGRRISISFGNSVTFDHLWLEEVIEFGQRVRQHRVLLPDGTTIVDGVYTIGSQRVHAFAPVTTDRLVIEVDDPLATIARVGAHRTGVESAPELERQPEFDRAKVG